MEPKAAGSHELSKTKPLPQLKSWFELLSKGYGLISSLAGLATSGGVPFVLPGAGGILIGHLIVFSLLFFFFTTFWASWIRPRCGSIGKLAVLLFGVGVLFVVTFAWLFDAVPNSSMMHHYPTLARVVVALSYAAAVGSIWGGLVLLLPIGRKESRVGRPRGDSDPIGRLRRLRISCRGSALLRASIVSIAVELLSDG